MDKQTEQQLSKFMSFILRHKPEQFGLKLAADGTCTIQELINVINIKNNWNVTKEDIQKVVKNCSKQRYSIEDDRIKANYGHSSVKVPRIASTPPDILYHGTNKKVVDKILCEGIKSMGRDVHMSEGKEFATLAGQRRGELVILQVEAKKASEDGIEFYYAGNDVWLSKFVPSKYLTKEGN